MKWKSACGAPLTDQNLHYLACKAFRNNNLPQSMDEINNLVLRYVKPTKIIFGPPQKLQNSHFQRDFSVLENQWNRFFSLKNTGAKEKREFIVYINSNATARTFYIHRSKKK